MARALPFQKPPPIRTHKAYVRVFYPGKPKDAEAVAAIYDKASKGLVEIGEDRTEFDPRSGRYVQLLKWFEVKFITEDDLDEIEAADNAPQEPYLDGEDRDALEDEETEGEG